VEVANPIGVALLKHKIGLHYIMLLNPPPHYRSSMDVIFLVGVVLKTTQEAVGVDDRCGIACRGHRERPLMVRL